MRYGLFIPKQAVGANLVYFDLWNPSNSVDVIVESVKPVVSGQVDVTGILGVDLLLTRTSAVGTGGTAATAEGTGITAMTFTSLDGSQPLNLNLLSARLTPTGGATAGAVISWASVFTEETNAGAYNTPVNMIDYPVTVMKSSGLRVVQGAVASVGNIGFNVVLNLTPR